MAKKISKLGEVILTYMRNAGMSQKELASKVGTSGSNISFIISGERSGSKKTLSKVMEVLEIPASEFIDLVDEDANILPMIMKIVESGVAEVSSKQLATLLRIQRVAGPEMFLTPKAIKEILDGNKKLD